MADVNAYLSHALCRRLIDTGSAQGSHCNIGFRNIDRAKNSEAAFLVIKRACFGSRLEVHLQSCRKLWEALRSR